MSNQDKKIIIGLSGGVDSSVSAMLLQQQGYTVEALFMKNWQQDNAQGECVWEADVEDAMQVCEQLAIPLNTVDLSQQYWQKVFTDFIEQYKQGLTPNPDVYCNQEIKFKAFMNHALELGASKIATGHYAGIAEVDGELRMVKAQDENKDQTYFLYRLNTEQISRSLFPLGDLTKQEVRALAKKHHIVTHDKKDSTGICFIGEQPFRDFLSQYIPQQLGVIRDTNDQIVGEHIGIAFYTLGQRQGLGIGGVSGASESPWYVVYKDITANELIVAQDHDHPLLYSREISAIDSNWIGSPPAVGKVYSARIRHRQALQKCQITELSNNQFSVCFEQAQRAAVPGQSIVLYADNICFGGGIIAKAA